MRRIAYRDDRYGGTPWSSGMRGRRLVAWVVAGGTVLGTGGCGMGALHRLPSLLRSSRQEAEEEKEKEARRARIERALSDLAERQAALERDIRGLEEEKARLEEVLRTQKDRAERLRCEAVQSEYRASLARQRAEHIEARARWMRCAADLAKRHSQQTAVGCLLGIVVTGGLGMAVCGGAALLKKKVSDVCGVEPPGSLDLPLAMEIAARRSRIDELDGCPRPNVTGVRG